MSAKPRRSAAASRRELARRLPDARQLAQRLDLGVRLRALRQLS
ncbi:MAG: hypothetical protein R3F11_26200 [Verrucomicrobiales bacterium]